VARQKAISYQFASGALRATLCAQLPLAPGLCERLALAFFRGRMTTSKDPRGNRFETLLDPERSSSDATDGHFWRGLV